MADPKLCSIPNCGKPVRSRGWCDAHHKRWLRHGDPLGGGTSLGAPMRYLVDAVLPYSGDDCLIWPFNKPNGYGQIRYNGRQQNVHRLVCIHANGQPPTSDHHACHTCGNGHVGCVNPKHMRWQTRVENMADKITHGTHTNGRRIHGAILTEEDVRQIRSQHAAIGTAELARTYGVHQSTISEIVYRRNWAWVE